MSQVVSNNVSVMGLVKGNGIIVTCRFTGKTNPIIRQQQKSSCLGHSENTMQTKDLPECYGCHIYQL